MHLFKRMFLGLLAVPCCFSAVAKGGVKAESAKLATRNEVAYQEVDLQQKLFERYYADLNDDVKAQVSLEQFKEIYDKSNMPAKEVVRAMNENLQMLLIVLGITALELSTATSWISAFYTGVTCYKNVDDADYIISDNHNRSDKSNYTPKPSSYLSTDKNYSYEHQGGYLDFDFYDNNTTHTGTNHGPRIPSYSGDPDSFDPQLNNYEYYYNLVEDGDIVWDPISGFEQDCVNVVTHAGMIVNKHKVGRYWRSDLNRYWYFNFVETVEAYASGVRFGFLDDERILRNGTRILRVNATQSQRINACDFMLSQLGKPYYLPILDTYVGPCPGRSQSTWYCTQLVFAAYNSVGINICEKDYGEYFGKNGVCKSNIVGHMIYNSINTSDLWMDLFYRPNFNHRHLTVYFQCEDDDEYSYIINNNCNYDITVAYNNHAMGLGDLAANFKNKQMTYETIPAMQQLWVRVQKDTWSLLNRSFLCYYVENDEAFVTIVDRPTGDMFPLQYFFVTSYEQTINYTYVQRSGKQQYWLNWFDRSVTGGHGRDWYRYDGVVAISSNVDSDWWDSVEVDYEMTNHTSTSLFNQNIWFNSDTGNFEISVETLDEFAWGYVEFNYTYTAPMILDYITVNTSAIDTDIPVGMGFGWYGIRVFAHYTCGITTEVTNFTVNADAVRTNVVGDYPVTVKYAENGVSKTTTFNVHVRNPFVTLIELEGDYQTTFIIGDEFNYDGLEVFAHFDNYNTAYVNNFSVDYSNVNLNRVGSYTVKVSYASGSVANAYYTVNVINPPLLGIELEGDFQYIFEAGDEFNCDGLEVLAIYDRGVTAYVDDFFVDTQDVDMDESGIYPVYIGYSENGITRWTEYEIYVLENEVELESITLSGSFSQLYLLGETFSTAGLVVTANYSDGSSQVVTNYTVDSSRVNMNKVGTYTVYVTYEENGIEVMTSFTVKVKRLPTTVGGYVKDPIVIKDPIIIQFPGEF